MRYVSKQQKENDRFCESVAKRFKLKKPLSLRASKAIHANCSCVEDVKAWIAWDSVRKKCAGLGACTIAEIRDAFGVTVVYSYNGKPYEWTIFDDSTYPKINYRQELQNYATVFRPVGKISTLIDDIRKSIAEDISENT